MFAYPVTDADGEVIGRMAVSDDKIPNLIMDGVVFKLGAAYHPVSKQFINFIIVPVHYPEDSK